MLLAGILYHITVVKEGLETIWVTRGIDTMIALRDMGYEYVSHVVEIL